MSFYSCEFPSQTGKGRCGGSVSRCEICGTTGCSKEGCVNQNFKMYRCLKCYSEGKSGFGMNARSLGFGGGSSSPRNAGSSKDSGGDFTYALFIIGFILALKLLGWLWAMAIKLWHILVNASVIVAVCASHPVQCVQGKLVFDPAKALHSTWVCDVANTTQPGAHGNIRIGCVNGRKIEVTFQPPSRFLVQEWRFRGNVTYHLLDVNYRKFLGEGK